MSSYKHILLAVDFSGATPLLMQRVAELARFYAAQISLVHVIEPMVIDPSYDVFPAVPLGLEQEVEAKARRELLKLADSVGITAEGCHVLVGATKTEILVLAKDLGVDLIVVGSHGRHGVALLLGSTANAILHGAPCDVLAVRLR